MCLTLWADDRKTIQTVETKSRNPKGPLLDNMALPNMENRVKE